MKKIVFAVVCMTILVSAKIDKWEHPEDNGVIILKDINFDWALDLYEHLLVIFIPSPCTYCDEMVPSFEEAAKQLKEQEHHVPLAKVNLTTETNLARKYGDKGYPRLKFFSKGRAIDYSGGSKTEEIIRWVNKKIIPPVTPLLSNEDIQQFLDAKDACVIFYGMSDSEQYSIYYTVALSFDDGLPFGSVDQPTLWEDHNVTANNIVIYKKFDQGKVLYNKTIEEKALRKWVITHQFPNLMEITKDSTKKIFGEKKDALVMFLNDRNEPAFQALKDAEEDLAGKIELSYVFMNDFGKMVGEYLGVSFQPEPFVIIIKQGYDITRFKPSTSEITPDTLTSFVGDFKKGLIPPFYKSQEIPEANDGPILVVVGKTFKELVVDSKNAVLIAIYSNYDDDTDSKKLLQVIEDLAPRFEKRSDIKIAKMEGLSNESEGLMITNIPSLRLFVKKDKLQQFELYGEKSEERVLNFIQEKAKYLLEPEVVEELEEIPHTDLQQLKMMKNNQNKIHSKQIKTEFFYELHFFFIFLIFVSQFSIFAIPKFTNSDASAMITILFEAG